MEREHLEELAAGCPAVRVVLDLTAYESITEEDRARLAFQVLIQKRHLLASRLRRSGRLRPVFWPARDAEEQERVLRYLGSECQRLETTLASLAGLVGEQVAA